MKIAVMYQPAAYEALSDRMKDYLEGLTALASRSAPTVITPHAGEFVRVTGEDVPMPYARLLEDLAIPDRSRIISAVKQILSGPRG